MVIPDDIREEISETFRKIRILGIIAGGLMIAFGIYTICNPSSMGKIWLIVAIIAVLLNGISQVVEYFRMPADAKKLGSLVLGALWIAVACFLLLGETSLLDITEAVILNIIGFFLGFNCIFSGIMSLTGRSMASNMGLPIASGVLDLILGILIIMAPISATLTIIWIVGAFVLIRGIALVLHCLSL